MNSSWTPSGPSKKHTRRPPPIEVSSRILIPLAFNLSTSVSSSSVSMTMCSGSNFQNVVWNLLALKIKRLDAVSRGLCNPGAPSQRAAAGGHGAREKHHRASTEVEDCNMIKTRMMSIIAGLSLLTMVMVGCGTATGAAVGAGSGAAIGAGTGNAGRGALIGTGVGAAVGAIYDFSHYPYYYPY